MLKLLRYNMCVLEDINRSPGGENKNEPTVKEYRPFSILYGLKKTFFQFFFRRSSFYFINKSFGSYIRNIKRPKICNHNINYNNGTIIIRFINTTGNILLYCKSKIINKNTTLRPSVIVVSKVKKT